MEEALMAQGEAIRNKQYSYRIIDVYRGVDLLLLRGLGDDRRDDPGLVLTCVCDAALTGSWAQGGSKRLELVVWTSITLLRLKFP